MPINNFKGALSTTQVTEVAMTALFDYDNPDNLPEWQWVESKARFKHVGNGVEGGVWEMLVYIARDDEDEDEHADAPQTLLPIIEAARKAGSTWLMFHQF